MAFYWDYYKLGLDKYFCFTTLLHYINSQVVLDLRFRKTAWNYVRSLFRMLIMITSFDVCLFLVDKVRVKF